jgi:hypothetical protein
MSLDCAVHCFGLITIFIWYSFGPHLRATSDISEEDTRLASTKFFWRHHASHPLPHLQSNQDGLLLEENTVTSVIRSKINADGGRSTRAAVSCGTYFLSY